jgi:hypothetical protein
VRKLLYRARRDTADVAKLHRRNGRVEYSDKSSRWTVALGTDDS